MSTNILRGIITSPIARACKRKLFIIAAKVMKMKHTAHTASEQATRTLERGSITLATNPDYSNWRIAFKGEESYVVIGWCYIQCH